MQNQLQTLLESLRKSVEAETSKPNADVKLINTKKSEAKALELAYDDLVEATTLAVSVAKLSAQLTGADKPEQPTLETIIQLSGLRSVYLPVAYRRLLAAGEITEPTAAAGVQGALSGLGAGGMDDEN